MTGIGTGPQLGLDFFRSSVSLFPVTSCKPARDTVIYLLNTSCDTLRIVSGPEVFHESIVHAGGSARIEAAYRQLNQELTLFLLALRPVWTPEEMAEHHRKLVRQLESHGPPALRQHLEEGEAAVVAGLPG